LSELLNGIKMSTVVADLQKIDTEIEAKARLKNIKRILTFFLLGRLIDKNLDRQIADLKLKKAAIFNSLEKQFKEIENTRNQIKEIINSGSEIPEIELNQWFERVFALQAHYSYIKNIEILAKKNQIYLDLLSDSATDLLSLQKELICNEMSRIICNGEYLAFSEKNLFNVKLKSKKENIEHFKQIGLIGNDYYYLVKQELETYQKFVDSYNPKFIERKKKNTRIFLETKISR